jgi:hypothetical protein
VKLENQFTHRIPAPVYARQIEVKCAHQCGAFLLPFPKQYLNNIRHVLCAEYAGIDASLQNRQGVTYSELIRRQ